MRVVEVVYTTAPKIGIRNQDGVPSYCQANQPNAEYGIIYHCHEMSDGEIATKLLNSMIKLEKEKAKMHSKREIQLRKLKSSVLRWGRPR